MNKTLDNKKFKARFWEIDFLRGIAVVMMIIFHFLWDLNYFYGTNIALFSGFWGHYQKIGASIFISLVGISLAVSSIQQKAIFTKYLLRGGKILGCAMMVTLATRFIYPKSYVIFGTLHFIGTAIILAYYLRQYKYLNLFLGIFFILLGNYVKTHNSSNDWLLIFGITSNTFQSVDYFPIFPWFGVVLIGLFIGNSLYAYNKRKFKCIETPNNFFMKFIIFLGNHSLFIYLVHQIVLYGLFMIVKIIFP